MRTSLQCVLLAVTLSGVAACAGSPASARPFDESQTLQGITFRVTSPNTATANTLTLQPSGLAEDNRPITVDVPGLVLRMETADLNADGSPEVYIISSDGKSESLTAFSANRRKSISFIFLPELTAKQARGWRGGEEFAVVENRLARRFPITPEDAKPAAGKMRQISYELHAGEASWILKADRTDEF